jgi:pimeloyl-ACP methyl ester carboxylesterase
MERLDIDDAEIEYKVQGNGQPVLLIAPAAIRDGLARPLFDQARTGGALPVDSLPSPRAPAHTPLTISRQAADPAELLRKLDVPRAHVAGHSYGGVSWPAAGRNRL